MRDPSQAGVGQERRWKQLSGTLDAFIWEADAESLRLNSVDDRAVALLGYPLDRWLTEDELRSRRDAVTPGTEHRRDTSLPTADGEVLWFHEVVTLEKGAMRGAMVHVTGLRLAARAPQAGTAERVGEEIIDRVDAAMVATDGGGTITYWNQYATQTYGYSRDDVVGRPLEDVLVPASARDRVREGILEAAAGVGWERELEALHSDGTTLARWVKAAPLREESGEIVGVVWISVDAPSGRGRSTLAASEAVKDGILQSALDCIVTMDASGLILDFNPAAERTFGISRDDAVGQELAGLIIPEHLREAHRRGLRHHLEMARSKFLEHRLELVGLRADGTEFPTELTVTRIEIGGAPVFAGFMRDLSEQRQRERRIAHLATRDQLTGLPNGRLLRDHLQLAVERATKANGALAVLHVDIDRFGMVNDTLGRASGDEALRAIAQRLDELGQAQVVARETGDEFLLVAEPSLHSTGGADTVAPAAYHAIAAAVVDAIERPLRIGGRELQLGAHVGMSLMPGDANDVETLLGHAEAALQEAQRRRKSVQIFEDRDRDGGDDLSFLTDLRGALGRDEFELHYQPIVTLPERQVVGAEALIRWRHPERGLVLPNDFMPLLEDTGMIHQVGQWVVTSAFAQLNDWMEARPDFTMALNVSPVELAVDGLVKRLVDGADDCDIDPSAVSVEITETVAMSDPERITLVLDEIAGAGFPLAIDDFGTGHSSLARLWRLPVSTVKIDRAFTAAAISDPGAGAMVATIIRLAEGMGVSTVAEGIETEEQFSFVSDHGCNLGQGFLFSRPVPAEEISALLRT